MKHVNNPALKTIKPDWPGTPLDNNNRFANFEYPFVPKMSDVLKWQFTRNPQKKEKEQDIFRLRHREDTSFLQRSDDCIVWLGHASFYIRLAGVQMLIDPVFYDQRFVKRYARHAFGPGVFDNLNYLLISHDHLDHCQERSVREVVAHNPGITVLTGLNMETLLKPWCQDAAIQMAGWYQQYDTGSAISIYYLPTRHWCRRGLTDTNKRLWGAFIIKTSGKTIYFGGDTGYGSHLKEVKKLFPDIDVAIIGAGAYKPEWFMHPSHISPTDTLKAFQEVGARTLIPMHYGTFDLSDEPPGEPYRILKAAQTAGTINGSLLLPDLGECCSLE